MKQARIRKSSSFSEALDKAHQETAGSPRGPGFHKLQKVMDTLDNESGDSEGFFMLLYSDGIPARLLWRALKHMGIKVSYPTVLAWRKLHQAHELIFRDGKVMRKS